MMLSHLDYEDTELQMLEKLRLQMAGQWTWHGLNTLCWAIGSISGTMAEEQENRWDAALSRQAPTDAWASGARRQPARAVGSRFLSRSAARQDGFSSAWMNIQPVGLTA